jgi:hypothetical protein
MDRYLLEHRHDGDDQYRAFMRKAAHGEFVLFEDAEAAIDRSGPPTNPEERVRWVRSLGFCLECGEDNPSGGRCTCMMDD